MSNALFFVVMVFLVAFLYFTIESRATTIEIENNEELLSGLDAARNTWIQNISFYGTYTYKRTVFFSEEDAYVKNIDDEKSIVAKGIICKWKDKYRLQVLYAKGPEVSSSNTVSNRSVDAIANNGFWLLYNPEQGADFAPSGSLNKTSGRTIENVIPDLRNINTPFSLFLDPIDKMPASTSLDSKNAVILGEGRMLLSFTGKSTSGNKHVKEVLVRSNEKIPVIEQIALRSVDGEGNSSSSIKKNLEWSICAGISVPSRIRSITGPLKPIGRNDDTWIVSEWESIDIGKRPPSDEDFILTLPPNSGLVGMSHYPKDGLVNIDALTDDDLATPGMDSSLVTQSDIEPNQYIILRRIFMVTGLILIALALIKTYKNRKIFS